MGSNGGWASLRDVYAISYRPKEFEEGKRRLGPSREAVLYPMEDLRTNFRQIRITDEVVIKNASLPYIT